MGRNNYFQFKQFKIIQEKAAMKVGTDGVLLGAWADTSNIKIALDVGTGTGLIALMLAQRCDAKITAIEIENSAADEATQNVLQSPWAKKIDIQNTSFQKFSGVSDTSFDLIVSNPPYFINDKQSAKVEIAIARHSSKLPLEDLAKCSRNLLNNDGRLALILPVYPAEKFIKIAETYNLNLIRLTKIRPFENKAINRYLMEFCKAQKNISEDVISIQNLTGSDYTNEYKRLTRVFYLNF